MMKMFKDRKGLVQLFIPFTVPILLVIALIIAIIFGGVALTTYILSINVWRIAGSVLLIIAGLSYTGYGNIPIPQKVALTMLGVGFVLVLLPAVSDTFGTTLGVVLG